MTLGTPELERAYEEYLYEARLPSFRELSKIADEAQELHDAVRPAARSVEERVAQVRELMGQLPVDMRVDEQVADCVNGIMLLRKYFPEAQRRAQNFVSELVQPPFNQVVDLSRAFAAPLPGRLGKANVRRLGNEYLVLIDSGLTRLIASVAETIAELCIVIKEEGELKFAFSPDAQILGKVDIARTRLYRIFQQYESKDKIDTAWLPLSPLQSGLATYLSECALQFVFHHELSHVVLGHCGDVLPILSGHEPPISVNPDSVREAQADIYGLMMGMLRLPGEGHLPLRAAHTLAGAELVFHATGLIERFGERKVFNVASVERLATLRSQRGQGWAPLSCIGLADLIQHALKATLPEGIYSDDFRDENGPLLMPEPKIAFTRVRSGERVTHCFLSAGKSRPVAHFAPAQFEGSDETAQHLLCMHLAATILFRLSAMSNREEAIRLLVSELNELGHQLECAEKSAQLEVWRTPDGTGLAISIRTDGEPLEVTWS